MTYFKGELLGLKLQSMPIVREPLINCTIFSQTKVDESKKQSITRMLKRALKVAAEQRWGNWRGYAFVYVLKDLPKLSAKLNIDLTNF